MAIFPMLLCVVVRCWRLEIAEETGANGFYRIGFAGTHHPNATPRHTHYKTIAGTAGNENVGLIERVLQAVVETVDGHVQWQVEPCQLDNRIGALHFVNDKSPGFSGMAGNRTEILAGHGKSHIGILILNAIQGEG
jgi:hypothetical protein